MGEQDWRITNQENYLAGVDLVRRRWVAIRPDWDHDHCEFHWNKFGVGGELDVGCCSTTNPERWICEVCFVDLVDRFRWQVTENSADEPSSPPVTAAPVRCGQGRADLDCLPRQVMIEFCCTSLVSEINPPRNLPDLLIRTTADFEIRVDGGILYDEVGFPVIELVSSLVHWADLPLAKRPDFEFDSMSTPESGWVWLRRAASGWRVGSIHQRHASVVEWSELDVQVGISNFANRVEHCARTRLKTDIGRWLPKLAARRDVPNQNGRPAEE